MRGMGFEPMRLAPTDLETVSLTTRTSPLCWQLRCQHNVNVLSLPRALSALVSSDTPANPTQGVGLVGICFLIAAYPSKNDPTETRTRVPRFKVWCPNHWTIRSQLKVVLFSVEPNTLPIPGIEPGPKG